MLRAHGLAVASDFRVDYDFEPHRDGDGTTYAGAPDLEVVLEQGGNCVPPATALPGVGSVTLLPCERAAAMVQVRVVGTTAGDFPAPFEVDLGGLPARIDRDALRDSAFGQTHPELLAVASNSSPLTVKIGSGGQPVIHAAVRQVSGRNDVPMYFRADGGEPLRGEHALKERHLRLLVNSPAGAMDPATRLQLPAVVLEVSFAREDFSQIAHRAPR
jgi:hypothetical protein